MAKVPDQIDKYKIESLVATGGMGAVFKGVHPTLGRPVILKKLTLRGNATITERFKREARILMDFRADHIVDVQDHFVQGRSHYIVMEYVDGQSVKELLDEQRYLDNTTAAYIILYTAKALQYAHSKGVVHRDIKPGNILISRRGEVKLADFGIASTQEVEADDLTTDGMTLGTPAYMAPEQFENSKTVDYRADIYSLGVMFYEMLVGQKPFPGGFSAETIRLIQKGKYKPMRKIIPTVAPELQRIVKSLIKPNPKRRMRRLDKVIQALENYLGRFRPGEVSARLSAMVCEDEIPQVSLRKPPRLNLYIGLSATLLLLVGVFSVYCGHTQYHKVLFKSGEYGTIQFTAEGGLRPSTTLYIDEGEEIPLIDRKIVYIKGSTGYKSMPLGFPQGRYRAKTVLGDEVLWSSFRIIPRAEGDRRILKVTDSSSPVRILTIDVITLAAKTGKDLRETAKIEVFVEGAFRSIHRVPPLTSGGVYLFKISAPGYISQEFGLKIDQNQSVVRFQAELETE